MNKQAAKDDEMENSECTVWLRANGLADYVQSLYDKSYRELEHIEDACRGRAKEIEKELKKVRFSIIKV